MTAPLQTRFMIGFASLGFRAALTPLGGKSSPNDSRSRSIDCSDSLAGMIHKVGLLPTCNHQQVPFAYKMYTNADDEGWKQSNAFKKAFSNAVDIEFLGVWQVFPTYKPLINDKMPRCLLSFLSQGYCECCWTCPSSFAFHNFKQGCENLQACGGFGRTSGQIQAELMEPT